MNAPKTIHLIGVGRVRAVEASELKPGDRLMWNYGSIYTVMSIEDVSPKFLAIIERDKNGKQWGPRRLRKDRLVARVHQEKRLSDGKQDHAHSDSAFGESGSPAGCGGDSPRGA